MTQDPSLHLNGLDKEAHPASPAHSAIVLEQNPLAHNNGLAIGHPNELVLLFVLQYPSELLVMLFEQADKDLSN